LQLCLDEVKRKKGKLFFKNNNFPKFKDNFWFHRFLVFLVAFLIAQKGFDEQRFLGVLFFNETDQEEKLLFPPPEENI
jgi:hypothetical protein